MQSISFDPRIPLALWWPLAAAAVVLLALYAASAWQRLSRRRWLVVIGLMAALVAVPLVVLLNPTWIERIPPPEGKPLLTILVDRSASMATRDAPGGSSRFEAGARLSGEAARALADRFEVRVRTFADGWTPATSPTLEGTAPDGASTDVATAVEQALDEARLQGQAVLLLSDGIHNAPGGGARLRRAADRAKALAAPVYVHTLGGPTEVDDLEITLGLPQELAFVDQTVPVVVSLRRRGNVATEATVSLSRDGQPVETRRVTLTGELTEEVFEVRAEAAGLKRYEIRAETSSQEVTTVNNTASLLVRVVDEPVRVLLLEGKPYWDTKFLIRTLAADPSVELTSIVRMAEGRLMERTTSRRPSASPGVEPSSAVEPGAEPSSPDASAAGMPVERWAVRKDAAGVLADAEALDRYQIVILGRDAEVFLSDEALVQLKRWLAEQSASLVCYRGAPASQISQRLGELMPVRWSPAGETRHRLQMTEAGRELRWLPESAEGAGPLAQLPSLAAAARVEDVKPLATVLATTGGERPAPVITYQPYGNGRVVVVEGAGMWRWAFLPAQSRDDQQVYGLFWRSLIRWLVSSVGLLPSQRMALRTDKVTFSTEESATATLLVHKDHVVTETPQIELVAMDVPADPGQVPQGDHQPEPGASPAPQDERSTGARVQTFAPVPLGDVVGQFQVRFGRLPEGRYLARIAGAGEDEPAAAAYFDVRGSLAERLDVEARPDVMQLVAEQSGGAMLDQLDAARLAESFEAHLRRSRPERLVHTTAWDRWWVLSGALVLWGTTWGLRRRWGLI